MAEMKIVKNRIKKKLKEDRGLVIIEAVIVFPIMFFVLFFIIFIGNMFYEQAKIDAIVMRNAVEGAECVTSPLLQGAKEAIYNGSSLTCSSRDVKVEPYRYVPIFGGGNIKATEDRISENVKNEINDSGLVLFANQKVNILGSDNPKIAMYDGGLLTSTFVVQVNYEIKFPIRFFGDSSPTIVKLSSRSEVATVDCPEFIRNVDMVVDLLDGTKMGEKIKDLFNKMNAFIIKISGKG